MASSEKIEKPNLKDGTQSLSGEEVVISGISGVFPNSDSVVDFMNNLYDKVMCFHHIILIRKLRNLQNQF